VSVRSWHSATAHHLMLQVQCNVARYGTRAARTRLYSLINRNVIRPTLSTSFRFSLASSRLQTRPYKGPNFILSHSHTIPPSPFYFGPPTHVPLAQFLAHRHLFPIGHPSPLDSNITSDPFALGSLIALMMEAARTFEMSVDIQLRTRRYIP
jgi:hypothetical protein